VNRFVSALLFWTSAIVVLLVASAVPVNAQAVSPPASGASRVLVLPFESPDNDPRGLWLGEASAVLITENLRSVGVNALTRTERVNAFEELNLPTEAPLSHASLIRVGQILAAGDLIVGKLRLSGNDLTIDARRIRLDYGRVQQQVTDKAPLRDLFALHQRVTRKLMALGGSAPLAGAGPSLEAFEQYIKGLVAEKPETQVKFLQGAISAYRNYDAAQLALWEVYTERSEHARALAAAQAVPTGSRLARVARFLAARSLMALKRYDEAFAGFKALLDEQPAASLYNNLGIIQIRRSATTPGRAVYYLTKASELDPEEPDYFFNLGYAYWLDRDVKAAIYWLREAVRRNTADGAAHFVLGVALQSAGSSAESAREKELAKQLSSTYAEWERKPASPDQVPRNLERISTQLEALHATRIDAARLGTAQREQRELADFHLQRGRRLFEQEQNLEALAELRKAIYLAPYESEPHLLIGRIYLRTGRAREAIESLRVALWSRETAPGRIALAEGLLALGDRTGARREATRALQLDPVSQEAKALLARLDKP
jgi:tetratricopeptide (TPR) repeat protein